MRSIVARAALRLALALAALSPALAASPDRLVIGMQLEPPHLDPTAGAAAIVRELVYTNLFEGLIRVDAEGKIRPSLATKWEVAPDGLSIAFHLRAGARFHDGRPLDAEAVRFSFDRARADDSVNAQKGWFTGITAVETPDAHTAIVRLTRPDPLFLFHMAQGDAVIVGPETATGNKRTPVGTGPYKFEKWTAGDSVTLVRNDAYDGDKPAFERVVFRFIADPAAQIAALEAGDVDAFPQFGAYEALDRFKKNPRFQVLVGTTEGETILALNNAKPPFDDVRVRRALSHAIDRNAVIDGAMNGTAVPIGSHFAPHHPAYVDLTGAYPYDPDKARALLAQAGRADGFDTVLSVPPTIYARRSAELIAVMLADVGVRARVENVEWATWLDRVFKSKNYDMTVVAHTEPLDIDIYGRDSYYFNYKSDRFKAGLVALDSERDETRRNVIYGDLQRILSDDAVNVFLFQLPSVTIADADLSGLWINRPILACDVTAVRRTR